MLKTIEDVEFEAGQVIFDTDEPLETAYFILEGSVDLELTLGARTIDLRIGPNHFLGDAAVAVAPKPDGEPIAYRGRAVASAPVRAAPIPIAAIRQELDACSPLLRAWFASFTQRVLLLVEELTRSDAPATSGLRNDR